MRNTHVQPQFSRPYSRSLLSCTVRWTSGLSRAASAPSTILRSRTTSSELRRGGQERASDGQAAEAGRSRWRALADFAVILANRPTPHVDILVGWGGRQRRNRHPPGETSCPSRPRGAKRGCPGSLGCPGKSIIRRTCRVVHATRPFNSHILLSLSKQAQGPVARAWSLPCGATVAPRLAIDEPPTSITPGGRRAEL